MPGERLRGLPREAVRVVGTNTLRVARNSAEFIPQLEEALGGFPIEIIAGREEARLVYLGAAHSLPASKEKRMVIDIGGGSTEFIIGKSFKPLELESLYMGCVGYSLRYFPDGRVDKKGLREAELAALKEIQTISHAYRRTGWEEAVGSSGSAKALVEILELNGLSAGGITRDGLEKLKVLMLKAGSVQALQLAGLLPSKRFPARVAKSVDAPGLGPDAFTGVPVRVRPRAPDIISGKSPSWP